MFHGDIAEDATIRFAFNTNDADGAPITLAGTPAISVYKDGSTTQTTAGVTLTVDFDGLTGYHVVTIDTSADAFYVTGSNYRAVITTGTVGGTSVVGAVVGHFSIQNRIVASVPGSVASVTAGVTLADDAITAAKYDESTAFPLKANDAGATQVARTGADGDTLETLSDQLDGITFLAKIDGSVNDAAATTTSFIGDNSLNENDDFYNGSVLVFTSGALKGVARRITDYTGATRTFTFGVAFPAAPANSVTFIIVGRID